MGLYPYINTKIALWEEKIVAELFKANIGEKELVTLHREQSDVLRQLLEGENIALSAPTSFGKSFIIDALIAIKQPQNVIIIVPTIALMDETRRRLYKKFGHEYKIITTSEAELSEKNILIFPQERSFGYIEKINTIDILIVDEFYKASCEYEKERSDILLKAIIKLARKTTQRYFLSPNISNIKDFGINAFTKNMKFIKKLDFSTVYTEINREYENISKKIQKKSFYYQLCQSVKKCIGIHNGKLHRSLSQIQLKLFEEKDNGLQYIISTSSIIEGVNTLAENVIMWKNKNGKSALNQLSYKNLIGRSGRMLKYFIGKVYLLECPKYEDGDIELRIDLSSSIQPDLDEEVFAECLTQNKKDKTRKFKNDMFKLIGKETFNKILKENLLRTSDFEKLHELALDMKENPENWKSLKWLNSENKWDAALFSIVKACKMTPKKHTDVVDYIKKCSRNWSLPIFKIITNINKEISIEDFFEIEKFVTFNFSALANDINILQKYIIPENNCDISSFVTKTEYAFLPPPVYQLEEFGLPRMISRKIHVSRLINFEDRELNVYHAIDALKHIGRVKIKEDTHDLIPFDKYIVDYFFDGITF